MKRNRFSAALMIILATLLLLGLEAKDGRDKGDRGRSGSSRSGSAARTPSMSRASQKSASSQRSRSSGSSSHSQQRSARQRSPEVKDAIRHQQRAVDSARQHRSVQASRPATSHRQITRTPSMSRADRGRSSDALRQAQSQQRRSVDGKSSFQRPSSVQQQREISKDQIRELSRQHLRQPDRRQAKPSRPDSRQHVKDYLQKSRHGEAARKSGDHKQTDFKGVHERQRHNREISKDTREHVRNHHRHSNDWFNDSFFDRHHGAPYYHRHGANWWRANSWNTVANWVPWGWDYPMYYDEYGYYEQVPDIYINYYPETTYPTVIPTQVYGYGQDVQDDWLPMGVFVASRDLGRASYSNMFVQLALSKGGELAGTYYNASTDETHPLEGLVDSTTQQAVWMVSDDPNSPMMSTGLYNLTQDVATIQVKFQDGSEQTWFLTRINE